MIYDFVMVETVGIGQTEVSVSQVVILIVAPSVGDGLQGVKEGIMEVADLLIVNKAEGNLLPVDRNTAADYKGASHFCGLGFRMNEWDAPPVLLANWKTCDG
jgi:LAO/AO transport system kinase